MPAYTNTTNDYNIWSTWTGTTTSSTGTSTDAVWTYWCIDNLGYSSTTSSTATYTTIAYHQPTEEERQQIRERDERRHAAEKRAEELLLEHLTAAQRATYKKNKWFVVQGGKTKQQYRINAHGGLAGNIEVLEGGKATHRLCAHPPHETCWY